MADRSCPQYIETHGYCVLTEGHDGDHTLERGERQRLGYSDLERGINEAPMTYLPALLITVVQRCVRERVFQEGGLEKTVARAKEKP